MFHRSELEDYYDIFLQILKSKAKFRKKKENSMNKAFYTGSKLFKSLEETCTFPLLQKMKNLKYLMFFPNSFNTHKKSSSKQEMSAALTPQRPTCLL